MSNGAAGEPVSSETELLKHESSLNNKDASMNF